MPGQAQRNDSTRHYLNSLRANGGLTRPTRGKWTLAAKFLTDYAKSIDSDRQLDKAAMAHSIPSVFQRPMQFSWVLHDDPHDNPLYEVVTGEWRGLLAVLALAPWKRFDLNWWEFAVPAVPANAYSWQPVAGQPAFSGDAVFSAPNAPG